MIRNASIFRRTLAYLLSGLLILQPVSAQVVVDINAPVNQQADVTTTAQGVPLVNIASPNANGLSHNKFESYSVDESHLILNNSDHVVDTLISGEINANPNLTDGTANIILNEVTGASRSLLQGYTEIAGDQAELIIANPNGITCNGCGFINTPRAVLSTGVPQISNGQLMSLSIDQGDILIDGDGINTGNIVQFDLISRAVQINGQLLARDLNVITGRNDVDYASLEVTPKVATGSNQPTLAIDSSLLGGMYANTIHLIATEQGVGVNLAGDMASNTGAVTLSADGTISINSVTAQQALAINSHAGDITVNDLAYGQSVSIDAGGNLNNSAVLAASGNIQINSSTTDNSGSIIAGLNTDGSTSMGAGLELNASQLSNSGQLIATKDAVLTIGSVDNQQGSIEAISGDLTLDQLTALNNANGHLKAGNDIQLTIDSFTLSTNHGLNAGHNLVINTDKIDNSGEFKIDSGLVLNLDQGFSNSGLMETSGDFTINALSFSNQGSGVITAAGSGQVTTTDDMDNQGVFTAATGMSINASNITNRGVLASGDTLTLTAQGAVINSNADSNGLPIASGGMLDGNANLASSSGGENGTLLFSVGDMNIYSDSLLNRYADIYSFGDLIVAKDVDGAANSFVTNSSSRMESAGSLTITTQLFENRRDPITDFDYSAVCGSSTDYLCTHTIVGGDDLGIPSDTPLSQAWLFDIAFQLNTGILKDEEKYIQSQENLRNLLLAASRTPGLYAGNNMTINAGGFANRGGLLSAANNLTINANDFVNETVVAATLGPGVDVEYGSVGWGLTGPYVGNYSSYFYADGTQLIFNQSVLSRVIGLKRDYMHPGSPIPNPDYFILLNPDAAGNHLSNDTNLPIAINKNGYIQVSTDVYRQPYSLQQSESGDLILVDDSDTTWQVLKLDQTIDLATIVDSHIIRNLDTGEYQLTMGDTTYPVVIDSEGRLQAQFDPDNMPIEFAIQKALEGYRITAEDYTSSSLIDVPLQMQNVDTTFFPGQIRAAGLLSINATNSVTNGLAEEGSVSASQPPVITLPTTDITTDTGSLVTPSAIPDTSSNFTELDNAIPPASDFVQIDVDTNIPDSSGLFTAADGGPFMVSTNAAVSNFIDIYGSGYLLERLGFQPEANVKRLGDGLYESYLIREAIMAQTGRRFLHNSLRNDQQQMRYLMDNAIAAQEIMDLTLGVRLTAKQVAALTHDIVWLEERKINGQRVLVPTLYLASVRNDDIARDSSILARNIQINAGQLLNTSGIVSDSSLNIKTENNLANRGNLQASNLLALRSGGNLIHSGEIDTQGDLMLQAEGSIVAQARSRIKASGGAVIDAANSINVNASDINIAGNADIRAGDSINVTGQQLQQKKFRTQSQTYVEVSNKFQSSNVFIGGNLQLHTAGDVNIEGSDLSTSGHADMDVGGLFQARNTQAQGGRISSGGSLALTTGKGIELNNVSVVSGDNLSLANRSGDMRLNQAVIQSSGNTQLQSAATLNVASSQINSAKDLRLSSDQGNLKLENTQLSSGGNTDVQAFQGAMDITSSKINSGGNTQLQSAQALQVLQSELNAQGRVDLSNQQAGLDIDNSSINAAGFSAQSAASLAVSGSQIESSKNIDLSAGQGDISLSQSQLNAGANTRIIATGNSSIEATGIKSGQQLDVQAGGRNGVKDSQLTSETGSIDIVADKGNVTLENSELNAGDNVQLTSVEGGITADEMTLSAKNNTQLLAGGGTAEITNSQINTGKTLQLQAKGGVNLTQNTLAGKDIGIVSQTGNITNDANHIIADNSVYMQAEGDILNRSVQTVQQGETQVQKETVWLNRDQEGRGGIRVNTTTTTSSQTVDTQLSTIQAGAGGVTQIAGGNIENQGNQINSAGGIEQQAGGYIHNSSLATSYSAQTETVTGLIKGQDQTTQQIAVDVAQTSLVAEGSIIQQAGGDITQKGAHIQTGNTLEQTAKGSISNENMLVKPMQQGLELKTGNKGLTAASVIETQIQAQNLVQESAQDINNEVNLEVAGNISLTGRNINNTQRIDAGENLKLKASEDISNTEAELSAGKNLGLQADGNITNTATTLNAGQNLGMQAGGDITLDTISTSTRIGGGNDLKTSLVHSGSTATAGNNVTLDAGNNLTIAGSSVDAGGNIALAAKGDIAITAVQDEYYSYRKTKKKRLFSSTTKVSESYRTENIASALNAGGNLTINSDINPDGSINTGNNSGKVQVSGSTLDADGKLILYGDNIQVIDQKEINYSKNTKKSSGFLGIGASSSGSINRQELLAASQLASEEDLSLLSASDITILGSELVSGGDLNLNAVGDILISADQELTTSQNWSEKTSFLSSLDSLYNKTEKSDGQSSAAAIASTLTAQGNINLDGSRVTIAGSDVMADGNIQATTDVGDIQIIGANEAGSYYNREKEINVGLGDIVSEVTDIEGKVDDLTDSGQASFTLANADYHSADNKGQNSADRASQLQAAGGIKLESAGDIVITGSDVIADNDADQNGDLTLKADGDVLITESNQTASNQSETLDGSAELGVVIQHQAVEVVKAIEQLKDAKDQLKQSEEDYRQYQKDLRVLSDRRDQLVADYNAEIPGVRYDDIQTLDNLIDDLEGDKDWYQAGVVLASANLVSKTTLLAQQTAAAISSTATYGFNAGVQLKIDATKTQSDVTSSTARGSLLAGNNINIQTGTSQESGLSQTLIKGSDLQATQDINIDTGDLTLEASQNSQQSQSNSEHVDATIAQTVYGAAGGPTVNVNLSRGEGKESSSTVNNSTLTAQNINLNSDGDTTIDGANIGATDKLKLNVGGNLIVASQQNSYSSNNHNAGISGGFGLGAESSAEQNGQTVEGAIDNIGQSNGEVSSISSGLNAGTGRTSVRQTELTTVTGNSVDINVGNKTTIAGAAIAAVDEDGADNEQLSIETQSLEVVHLNDSSYSNQLNQGVNTGVGVGSTKANNADPNVNVNTSTMQYSNSSNITEGKTLATIGQGTITVRDDQEAGTDSTTELNRDIDNTTLELYDVDRQQGNVDLTVDTRLLSETGRDQIAEDLLKSGMIANAIKLAATTDRVGVEDLIDEVQKSNNTYEAVKAEIKKDPALAEALQNPDLTAEQKETMLNSITQAVMVKLGYDSYDNHVIATSEVGANGEQIAGFYSEQTGDAYINDQNTGNTEGLVTTAGHEAAHAMDDQKGGSTEESYANNFGENLANYTDMALDINGYDAGMAQSNSHTGNATSTTVQKNNANFTELDKTQGDNYCANGYSCYGGQTEQILIDAKINPQPVETLEHYQIRERVNENGIIVGYEAYNPETKNSIIMLPQELNSFKQVVSAVPFVGYSLENMTEAQHTGANAQAGLHDDGYVGGATEAAGKYLSDPNSLFDLLSEFGGANAVGKVFRFNGAKVNTGNVLPEKVPDVPNTNTVTSHVDQPSGGMAEVPDNLQTHTTGNNGSFEAENDFGPINQPVKETGASSNNGSELTQSDINQKVINDQGPWDPDTGQAVSAGNQKVIDTSGLEKSQTSSNTTSGSDLTPVVVSNMPTELTHQATSGVNLVANPDKTTTILGSYVSDTSKIIDELNYPKNLDFDAKQGGFNVLNAPDEFYKNPNQFWTEYNKSFLDKAIERGDDIILTTKPTDSVLNKYDDFGNYVGRTGFGKEIDYLDSKGYIYDPETKKMVKP